ncbi:MFS transporter [Paenibacillus spiritus]|uniref:MFS transporter n=1 Tax=Paenibacillus spiritus TaxID=2496557 RepID=A0A5J5G8A1_9BACL|nr:MULTISPECIES: sugar efflux transporter [Paenibacillus]KAA9003956.1 MFS transporter [Paenibacillus spiritus]
MIEWESASAGAEVRKSKTLYIQASAALVQFHLEECYLFARIRGLFRIPNYTLFVAGMMLIGIAVSVTSPYLSLYCTRVIGMSTGLFGLFMACVSLTGVLVNTILAKYADSGLNRKLVIVAATACSALGYASYLVFHEYMLMLITVSLLVGFGAPAVPQIFASAREAVSASGRTDSTFANSLLRSLFSLGFLIGPLIGSFLLLQLGYRGVFLGTSAFFAAVGCCVFFFLHSKQEASPVLNLKRIGPAAGERTVSLRERRILLPFLAMILLSMCNTTYNLNIPLFVVNQLGGTESQAGIIIALSAGLEIPLMIGLGSLASRFGNRKLMMTGCVLAGIYHILLLNADGLWQVIAGQLLQASFVSMVVAIGLSYFQDLLPATPGLATILYSNSSTLGSLLGNLTGGLVAQIAGYRNVYWLCLGLVAVSLALLSRAGRGEKTDEAQPALPLS